LVLGAVLLLLALLGGLVAYNLNWGNGRRLSIESTARMVVWSLAMGSLVSRHVATVVAFLVLIVSSVVFRARRGNGIFRTPDRG
jgi:hypothetical protein